MATIPENEAMVHPYGGRGPMMMGITWSEACLATALMLLRTYTNARVIKSFGWDYYLALFTLIVALVAQSIMTVGCTYGLGNHIALLSGDQVAAAGKWSWISQMMAINAIGFGKLAVIAFLLRIQDRAQGKGKYFLYFVGFSNVVINLDQTIQMLVICKPLARQWDHRLQGSCPHVLRTNYVGYFQGSWSATSDVVLALYPLVVFRNLKMSRKIKISMFLLLGGGILAGVSSAIKTANIHLIAVSDDAPYAITALVTWSFTECWLVLILGSFPPLRALFLRLSAQIRSAASRSRNTGHGYITSKGDKDISLYARKKPSQSTEDHESEEYIMSDQAGIVKTTNIQISRIDKGISESDDNVHYVVKSPV